MKFLSKLFGRKPTQPKPDYVGTVLEFVGGLDQRPEDFSIMVSATADYLVLQQLAGDLADRGAMVKFVSKPGDMPEAYLQMERGADLVLIPEEAVALLRNQCATWLLDVDDVNSKVERHAGQITLTRRSLA